MTPERTLRTGETVLGLASIALGIFIAYETWTMTSIAAPGAVGPKLFPWLIAIGLALVGARLLFEAFAGRLSPVDVIELDWKAVALIAGAFLVPMLLLETIGWIPSGTVLFVIAARAFGSRSPLRDALIGVAMTAITFVVFDYGLNLDLPVGTLFEDMFDRVSA